MPFNPYHHWLGLSQDLNHPNYFQLLGIGSKVEDPVRYQALVEDAVRTRLAMLAQVDAGQRQPLLEQVTQRVRRAGIVLADSESRAEYLRKLKAAKSLSTESPSTERPAASAQAHQPSQRLSSAIENGSEWAGPKTASILFAKPIDSFSNLVSEPGIATGLSSTRNKPKKKKLPTSILICTGLICVASIVGPLLVVNRLLNHNPSPVTQNDPGQVPVKEPDRPKTQSKTPENPGADAQPKRESIAQSPPRPAAAKRPDRTEPGADRAVDEQTFPDQPPAEQALPRFANNLPAADPVEPNSNGSNLLMTPASRKELTPLELYAMQRLSRRIQAAFRRRDAGVVALIDELKQKLATYQSQSDPQGWIRKGLSQADSYQFIQTQLTGFWNQVRQGYGRTLPRDFAVEGIPHQIRSRSDNYVEFVLPGGTVKHFYQYMPPSVAIAGARNHDLVDTTSNRLSLAAFIATQAGQVRERYEDDLQKLLQLTPTESDRIKFYVDESVATGAASLKIPLPQGKLLDQALKEFLASQAIGDLKKLSPEEAVRTGRNLLSQGFADPRDALIAIEVARRLAIAGGGPYLLADAVLELSYLTDVDLYELYYDSFDELAWEQLNVDQIQRSMEIIYPLTETADKDMVSRFKRLKTKLKKQGAVFGLLGFAQLSELR